MCEKALCLAARRMRVLRLSSLLNFRRLATLQTCARLSSWRRASRRHTKPRGASLSCRLKFLRRVRAAPLQFARLFLLRADTHLAARNRQLRNWRTSSTGYIDRRQAPRVCPQNKRAATTHTQAPLESTRAKAFWCCDCNTKTTMRPAQIERCVCKGAPS